MVPTDPHEDVHVTDHRAVSIPAIVGIYMLAGATWIVASDLILTGRSSLTASDAVWSIAKGLGFVTATALLLVGLLRRRQHSLDAERRRADELAAALAEADRMDAVGRLAGGIAHDFNNLLAVIRGSAELARSEFAPADLPPSDRAPDPSWQDAAESVRFSLDTIIESSHRAERLTAELQTVARRNRMDLHHVDLGAVLEQDRDMIAGILPESVHLEIRRPDVPIVVGLDTERFNEVLLNLAGNARDAMPEGGTLTFSLERLLDDALLQVTDTGRGMTDDEAAHCFEPFYTTKPEGVGNGLGLSLAYGVIRQSGGSIRVDSEPGRGTRFEICLPLAPASGVGGTGA